MFALGLEGTSGSEGRDLTIDAMKAVALRLSRSYPAEVHAIRYPDGPLHEVDGFMVWTGPVATAGDVEWRGPTLFVPVRRRLRIGRRTGAWNEVESVPAAASRIGHAVRPKAA